VVYIQQATQRTFQSTKQKEGWFVLCFLDLVSFNFIEAQANQSVVSQSERVLLRSACVWVAWTLSLTDCINPSEACQEVRGQFQAELHICSCKCSIQVTRHSNVFVLLCPRNLLFLWLQKYSHICHRWRNIFLYPLQVILLLQVQKLN